MSDGISFRDRIRFAAEISDYGMDIPTKTRIDYTDLVGKRINDVLLIKNTACHSFFLPSVLIEHKSNLLLDDKIPTNPLGIRTATFISIVSVENGRMIIDLGEIKSKPEDSPE